MKKWIIISILVTVLSSIYANPIKMDEKTINDANTTFSSYIPGAYIKFGYVCESIVDVYKIIETNKQYWNKISVEDNSIGIRGYIILRMGVSNGMVKDGYMIIEATEYVINMYVLD